MATKQISTKATEVTGICIREKNMYVKGQRVSTFTMKEGLSLFIKFLEKSKNNVLYAHNCKSYDSKVLFHALESEQLLESFLGCALGFVDTYILFKSKYPDLEKYNQPFLAAHFLSTGYNAHNAVDDVAVLQSLCSADKSLSYISAGYFLCQNALSALQFNHNVGKNINSLKHMLDCKVVSKSMAKKNAGSGLSMHHLHLAFERNGCDGIRAIFTELVNSSVRVTKSNKVIDEVSNYLLTNHRLSSAEL